MDETKTRLIKCFQVVFPELSESAVETASPSSTPAWDSIKTITLVNVIEEEFEIVFDFDQVGDLDSFDRFLQYVQNAQSALT
jgi:acyl carrier protein